MADEGLAMEIRQQLRTNLTPEELDQLGTMIQPEVAQLLTKGIPALGVMLGRLAQGPEQMGPGSAAGFRAPGAAPLARGPQQAQTYR